MAIKKGIEPRSYLLIKQFVSEVSRINPITEGWETAERDNDGKFVPTTHTYALMLKTRRARSQGAFVEESMLAQLKLLNIRIEKAPNWRLNYREHPIAIGTEWVPLSSHALRDGSGEHLVDATVKEYYNKANNRIWASSINNEIGKDTSIEVIIEKLRIPDLQQSETEAQVEEAETDWPEPNQLPQYTMNPMSRWG